MAESMVIDLLKTIGEKVGYNVWETIVGAADIDSQVKGLQDIKNTIEATLLDAHSAQVYSHSQRDVLDKLERGLAKLISKCSTELTERCQSPLGEDWPKIQHIPNITIKPANTEKLVSVEIFKKFEIFKRIGDSWQSLPCPPDGTPSGLPLHLIGVLSSIISNR